MQTLYLPTPDDQLFIWPDGASKDPGIGFGLFVLKEGKQLPCLYYSAQLKQHQNRWYACESEAASTGTAMEAFYHIIRESNHPVIIGVDSKPVLDAGTVSYTHLTLPTKRIV